MFVPSGVSKGELRRDGNTRDDFPTMSTEAAKLYEDAVGKEVFEKYGATTHWPHDNMELRGLHAKLADGTLDPRNRDEPLEKPEYTSKLLRLAGVESY